ncbi:MAG: hypothetical protein KTR27_15490 [Leptolyngbyaceae cyanobacterium MAG.088]|nr:hypothetical protein [Leptolyngbyaceae cyanobacterium MAG.088]
MTLNKQLTQRVMNLSPRQRAALATQLSLESSGLQRLVAYVVPKSHQASPKPSALKDLLKSKLPTYMVPAAIVPLEAFPRTANGKIDVNALPEPQLTSSKGSLVAPRNAVEETLAQIWQDVLKLKVVGIHNNFFELGGDSILSIQIVSRAREAGLRLAPNQLFEQPTIAELAAVVNLTPAVVATQGIVTGEVPLTPIQQWFFDQKMAAPHHWHQAMVVELPNDVSHERVEGAISALWTHHDALRLSFSDIQINIDAINPPKPVQVDLSRLDESEQRQAVADHGSQLHAAVNLAAGGLMRTAFFTRGAHRPWLLLSLHHLVVDAVSWQILLRDLATLLNGPAQLPEKTTSFKSWAETLREQAIPRQSEADFWITQVEQSTIQLPRDYAETVIPTEATTQTVTVALSQDDTQALIQTVPAIYNTQINDALLTALAHTLLQWVEATSGSVRVEVEAHGREQIIPEIDLSRTVGWLTTTYPVSLPVRHVDNYTESLKLIKEQLRQVPDRGIGYGLLRYLGDDAIQQRLAQASPSEVLFNYLGQRDLITTDSDLRIIHKMDVGMLRDPRNQRGYLVEINAWVTDGQLQINWRYDTNIHWPDTIKALANQYLATLKSLIAQCTDPDSGGFTPSDFPDADFNQTELDDFIGQLTGEA